MATVVAGGNTFVTTDAATYTTGSFTPAANDLLVAVGFTTGETSTDWTMSDSQGLGPWSKIARNLKASSADIMETFVSGKLAAASSMTVTYSHASGNTTGGGVIVFRVSGMSQLGGDAIRGIGGQDNQAASTTPAPVLPAAALTGNACITVVFNASNPGGVTVPSGWTAVQFNLGYITPTTGNSGTSRNSGFTGTTVTWGSTSATAFCAMALELDTGALGPTRRGTITTLEQAVKMSALY